MVVTARYLNLVLGRIKSISSGVDNILSLFVGMKKKPLFFYFG